MTDADIANENELFDYPLAGLTSWHIGGNAARFYAPPDINHLARYLNKLPLNVPCCWLGLGSNVLVLDEGVKGAVIHTREWQAITPQNEGTIVAEGGVTCAKFARFCSKRGFAKAAFFAGIPGTIGGALAMNAGAFGGETWEWVKGVWIMDRQGKVHYREPSAYHIAYRHVSCRLSVSHDEVFAAALFQFPYEPTRDGMAEIRELLRKRSDSQPIGTLNCGSVYRNPPGDHAARLIEACQLKGYQVGDALISPKHANFIINLGQAKAKDVCAIMSTIEAEVFSRFGIALVPEVRILGQQGKRNG